MAQSGFGEVLSLSTQAQFADYVQPASTPSEEPTTGGMTTMNWVLMGLGGVVVIFLIVFITVLCNKKKKVPVSPEQPEPEESDKKRIVKEDKMWETQHVIIYPE